MIEICKPDATLAKILPSVSLRPGIKYIPSRYAVSFEHSGKQYVFQNLTKQCIEGVLPESAMAGEGCDDLIKSQFLVPEDKDECAYYNQISALMRAYSRKKGIRGYTILPTFCCNARCIYCYEEGMKQVTMTPEIVEQTIRFILETHEGDKVKLSWFGGEPLLGEKTIDRICEGMRDAGLEYKSSMISNGSLITPEIVAKMAGDWKLSHIQISMDGAEQDYILRKHYYVDHDDYHSVMNAVSDMSAAGIDVTIRCNVDEDNWDRIPQYLSDLRENARHKDKVGIYLAPLNAVRMGDGDVAMWVKIRDAWRMIEEAGVKSAPFMGLGLGFRTNHCMADGGSVVINTVDGKVVYDVKPGTQSDTRVRLKNKGVPTIRNNQIRGDHYVTLVVETPTKLSKEAKDLLRQFDALTGDSLNQAERETAETGGKKESKKKKFWKN